MKNYYITKNINTNDLFVKLKIFTLEQLYEQLSIIEVFTNKTDYKYNNIYKTRGEDNGNLRLIKQNTTLMKNYYINKGIKLFNQLPTDIKQIHNKNKFKSAIKNMYMKLFD
jgi:hypothetical protein